MNKSKKNNSSKKVCKKAMFVDVITTTDDKGSLIVERIGYKIENMGGILQVDPKKGSEIKNYANFGLALANPNLTKITSNVDITRKALMNQTNQKLPKEEWHEVCTFAKGLGLKECKTIEEIMKELNMDIPEPKKSKRWELEDKVKSIMDVFVKLKDIENKKEEEEKKANEWKCELEYNIEKDAKGKIISKTLKNTLKNALLILENDSKLKIIAYNKLSAGIEINGELKDLAWKKENKYWDNYDYAQLESYITLEYGKISKNNLDTAFKTTVARRKFHPVADYLERVKLIWDGVKRVETIFVEHLGAEDNKYTREVTTKVLLAAIERVVNPGAKFDTMLVLDGPQGNGKSTMLSKLGQQWYTENLSLNDLRINKVAEEKLRGQWIVEISELAGMRKIDMETLKGFISRRVDEYRPAYGRVLEKYPRQCVLIGTTNAGDNGFLRDPTGNRRYWPLRVKHVEESKSSWNIEDEEVDQIWAEAMNIYEKVKNKEGFLRLSKESQDFAEELLQDSIETSPKQGQIEQYLEMLLPKNWTSKSVWERQQFVDANVNGSKDDRFKGTKKRKSVCVMEIYYECFNKDFNKRGSIERSVSDEIAQILRKLGWKSTKTKRFDRYGPQLEFVKKS